MIRKISWFVAVILAVALFALALNECMQGSSVTTSSSNNPAIQLGASNAVVAPSSSPTQTVSPSTAVTVAKDKEALVGQAMSEGNSRPIKVYGQVIDQFGIPVSGVAVHGAIVLGTGFGTNRTDIVEAITDAEGKFSFEKLHGYRFGVKFEKPGYEYNSNLYVNWWNNYKPDYTHPAIFVIYKDQGPTALVHAKFTTRIPYDGTSDRFSIAQAHRNTNGDLQLVLLRNPLKIRRGYDHFDWRLQIQMIGGGLIQSKDEYSNEAPSDGYVSSFEFSEPGSDPTWIRRIAPIFYVHLGNGNYGKIMIDLSVDSERQDGTGIIIEEWINPTGSRNLEFDHMKTIQPAAR